MVHTLHTMQDYIVLCMDVGPSMDIAPPSGGETSLEMAIKVANQIVQQKVRGYMYTISGMPLVCTQHT